MIIGTPQKAPRKRQEEREKERESERGVGGGRECYKKSSVT